MEVLDLSGTAINLITGGTSSAAWATVNSATNLNTLMPSNATHVSLVAKAQFTAANDDGVAALSPIDLGAGVGAVNSPYLWRAQGNAAGAKVFFGTDAWFLMDTAQQYYYRKYDVTGTISVEVDFKGFRFEM